MRRTEGMIEVDGGRVWYARLGEGDAMPLLVLHGGPGAAHDYVAPFAERMGEHRPTLVYDQLGCGRSDHPDDPSLWTLDRACREVDQVRAALGLDECHLFGQSWGGWLSIEYLTRGSSGVARPRSGVDVGERSRVHTSRPGADRGAPRAGAHHADRWPAAAASTTHPSTARR